MCIDMVNLHCNTFTHVSFGEYRELFAEGALWECEVGTSMCVCMFLENTYMFKIRDGLTGPELA